MRILEGNRRGGKERERRRLGKEEEKEKNGREDGRDGKRMEERKREEWEGMRG